MGDKTDLLDLFLDTLDPQQRLNMTLAMKLDVLSEKMDGEEKEDDDISDELLDLLGQDVVKTQEAIHEMQRELGEVQREMSRLRGALDETINQLREIQGGPKAPKPTPTEVTAAVQETQAKAAAGITPAGHRSRAKSFRGVYCRNCAKELTGKHQSLFCSRRCAARWRTQHPDELATPRLSIKENGFEATVAAGIGVTKGSVSA